GVLRVLDGQVVKAELLLQLVQQQVFGIVQADPDEAAVVDRQHVADLVQGDVVAVAFAVVGHAVDDTAGQGGGVVHAAHPAPPGRRGQALSRGAGARTAPGVGAATMRSTAGWPARTAAPTSEAMRRPRRAWSRP